MIRVPRRLLVRQGLSRFCTYLIIVMAAVAIVPLLLMGSGLLKQAILLFEASGFFAQTEFNAIVGSLILVGLSSLIVVPWGVLLAIYCSEYSDNIYLNILKKIFFIFTEVPPLVLGLFTWLLLDWLAVPMGYVQGVVVLVMISLPIFTKKCLGKLEAVSLHVREASIVMGMSRLQSIVKVFLPTAGIGVVWSFLFVGVRAFGYASPLLLTTYDWSPGAEQKAISIPTFIYHLALSSNAQEKQSAWFGCLLLIVIILTMNVILDTRYSERER